MKTIDMRKSVYELVKEHPEVADIMLGLGFKDIVKPLMLNTAGRVVTIPKGAALKKIDLEEIKIAFANKGFEVLH